MHEQVIVGEAIAGRAATVRKTLYALSTNLNANTFDLAELLYEAQANNYCPGWGYSSVLDFAEKELKLKKRKAQYLSRIVKVYRAVGLTRDFCEKVGTSKLREITTLDPDGSFFNREKKVNEPLDEHIVRLITDADEMTQEKIKDEVARLKGQVGPDRRVIRSFSTTQSAWDNVFVPAMEKIRRRLGDEGRDDEGNAKEYTDGVVYEMMAAEINADPTFEEPLELPTEESENPEEQPAFLPMELI